MTIEGLEHLEKDGWELVRIGKPVKGVDWVVNFDGSPVLCEVEDVTKNWPIIRKKPKQYRPFANAAEFAPHRDRWIRRLANGGAFLVSDYSNEGFCYDELNPVSWEELFNMGYVFDNPDGTTDPFGVEVQS